MCIVVFTKIYSSPLVSKYIVTFTFWLLRTYPPARPATG